MKYLKIEDNKGHFLRSKDGGESEWIEIDKVNKDDLLSLLNTAISSEFEMDVYAESNMANKAHQIIYKNIFEKFSNLETMKSKFKDESESLYKEAMDKYSEDITLEQ
jgi:hypothetical protein